MNGRQSHVIIRPIINEKTVNLAVENKYTFEVATDANKIEIAEAFEQLIKELFPKNKCRVLRVNTSAIRGRLRKGRKFRPAAPKDSKKAIITIDGDPLEFFTA